MTCYGLLVHSFELLNIKTHVMKKIITTLALLISFFSSSQNYDYIWTGLVNEDWSNSLNWMNSAGNIDGLIPNSNHNVLCPSNAFRPLKIFPEGSECNTLTIDASNTTFVVESTYSTNHLVCNSLIIDNSNGIFGMQINYGKIEVLGDLSSKGYIRLIGGEFEIHGNVSNYFYFFVYSNALVDVHGDFNNEISLTSVSNLRLVSNSEISIGGNLNWNERIRLMSNSKMHVNGNITLGASSEAFIHNGSEIYCKGNWDAVLASNFTPYVGSKVIFNGDSQQICNLGDGNNNYFQKVEVNKPNDTLIILQDEVMINGDFDLSQGVLKIENATLDVNGDFNSQNPFSKVVFSQAVSRLELSGVNNTIAGGISYNDGGTVCYDRVGDQNIAAINYFNLEIENEGVKNITTQGLNAINGDFHVFPLSTFEIQGFMFLNGLNILNEGLLKINESFLYATDSSGIFDASNGGIEFTDNSNSGALYLEGNVLSLGALDNNGGRVGYVSSQFQQIDTDVTYNILESWYGNRTIDSDLNIMNELKIQNSTITTNGNTVELGISSNNPGVLNNSNGFINGKFKRWFGGTNSGDDSGLFPLSDNSGDKRFIKVEYQEATDGGTLTAEWIPQPMGYNYTSDPIYTNCNGPFNISNVCDEGYWSMTPGDGISNTEDKKYDITLDLEGSLSFIDNCHLSAVKRTGTSPWIISGTHGGNNGTQFDPVVTINDASGWSNWGLVGGTGSALPVELSSFGANCNENGVLIHWTTYSEFNSLDFIIEKSEDANTWDYLSSVDAQGHSNQKLNYSYLDDSRGNSSSYYRLIQRDIDGSETIYDPTYISCISNNNNYSVKTFPNPSKSSFNITLDSKDLSGNAYLHISNLKGKNVYTKNINVMSGVNNLLIDSNFEKGVYLISIQFQDKVLRCKHVVN